jgi:hypothetical protein
MINRKIAPLSPDTIQYLENFKNDYAGIIPDSIVEQVIRALSSMHESSTSQALNEVYNQLRDIIQLIEQAKQPLQEEDKWINGLYAKYQECYGAYRKALKDWEGRVSRASYYDAQEPRPEEPLRPSWDEARRLYVEAATEHYRKLDIAERVPADLIEALNSCASAIQEISQEKQLEEKEKHNASEKRIQETERKRVELISLISGIVNSEAAISYWGEQGLGFLGLGQKSPDGIIAIRKIVEKFREGKFTSKHTLDRLQAKCGEWSEIVDSNRTSRTNNLYVAISRLNINLLELIDFQINVPPKLRIYEPHTEL